MEDGKLSFTLRGITGVAYYSRGKDIALSRPTARARNAYVFATNVNTKWAATVIIPYD